MPQLVFMCTIVQKVQRFVYQPTSAFDQYKWNFAHVVTEKTSVCKNIPTRADEVWL